MRICVPFWFLLWICIFCQNVDGFPSDETLRKARCYANCITQNAASNETENPCQTPACQDCLAPCKTPTKFPNESTCKKSCNNASSCLKSCEFLTRLKNFTSIVDGDSSMPPTPGKPTVTSLNFTSIALQWPRVLNASGTAVYLIEITFTGESSRFSPIFSKEVFVKPEAILSFEPCAFTPNSPIRSEFKDILFSFRVAALTENSFLSYGPRSNDTTFPKPDPVTNVTLDSLVYDGARSGDKLVLTASWIAPKGQENLISKYGMRWSLTSSCKDRIVARTADSTGPQTTSSMNIFQELTKCNHELEIYTIIGCSVSLPAILKYTYPGCQNITGFPMDYCYKFDPPDAPLEDRMVRNIRLAEAMTPQQDYRFKAVFTWDPPAYPYKNVTRYFVRWAKESIRDSSGFQISGGDLARTNRHSLSGLLPGTFYRFEVRAIFPDGKPQSEFRQKIFPTPGVDPDQVKVPYLKSGQFSKSSLGGSFSVVISWGKPTFNYSTLDRYTFRYQAGSNNDTVELLHSQTKFNISGILHGELVHYWVTPRYKHKDWIKGVEEGGNMTAPVPPDDDIRVKNIQFGEFVRELGTSRYSVNVTWTGPAFNFTFRSYYVEYELTGYQTDKPVVRRNVNKPETLLSGIKPKEIVTIKITPTFDNPNIKKVEYGKPETAPLPDPSTVTVRNLTYMLLNSSTSEQFNYLILWKKPLFNESNVKKYYLKYRRTGNLNREKLFEFKIVGATTSSPVHDLIPGDRLEVEVTPEFVATVITGIPSRTTISPQKPDNQEIRVRNLRAGSFLEDEGSNTFSVNFTWEPPPFKYSAVQSYTVSYEFFGGYSRKELSCLMADDNGRSDPVGGCSKSGDNMTSLQISGVFPRESVAVKVTPSFSNMHITGQVAEERVTAPQPREELVQVNGLKHDGIFPTANDTFRTTVSWGKPLFTHSDVEYYRYKVVVTDPSLRKRRGTPLNTGIKTTGTNVTIDGISRVDGAEFQVTPVFVVSEVTGTDAKISLNWKLPTDPLPNQLTTTELAVLSVGVLLALLIATGVLVWCYRERRRQMKAKGRVFGKNALMIDHWEVDGDLVSLEEELGEGAFGKVYKGILKELNSPSRKPSMMPPISTIRKNTLKQTEGFTVAVKMLHGMADSDQRREFLEEIQLMKAVGTHKNIVNMLGCCTVEEPMFLLVEYIPYGDLLHYLRKRRGKVKEYLGDESRGPYRSTYCETYVIDGKFGERSTLATRNDRIYVNSPDAQKGDSGNIQILSFTQSSKVEDETGKENKGMTNDEGNDEDDDSEETLTPGDLLAFAWQISEGMEYLARKGFVHRDLAARNVLVGEHKIAKVADFGLTRHVYEEKVYHAKRNRKLPLKWMSIEAIFDQTFTAQSDVWAFGVLLWELVTLGGTPYPTINNRELLRLLKGGYRMEKPDICNDEMYKMMMDCWLENPDDRPNFARIRERLEEMMQKDNPYLDFSVLDESRDYYNVPSFNSLTDESEDELFDKESEAELLEENTDDIHVDEGQLIADSNKNEIPPFPKPTKSLEGNIEPLDVDKIEFHNNAFRNKDFHDFKDVKVDFDALEMALYRPGSRGIVL